MSSSKDFQDRIIIALDVDNLSSATNLIQQLTPSVRYFKVGKELFTAVGPDIIKFIHDQGAKVFLDLKFHDIPNTVKKAIQSALKLGVSMCNVHASGGGDMMRAAAEICKQNSKNNQTQVIAVTVLTSMNQDNLNEIGVFQPIPDQVLKLAQLAKESGLHGVVASAQETPIIRKVCGDDFLIVTPGIRPSWAATNDQKRVITPKEAFQNGSNYLVIGRPVTENKSPQDAFQKILSEL